MRKREVIMINAALAIAGCDAGAKKVAPPSEPTAVAPSPIALPDAALPDAAQPDAALPPDAMQPGAEQLRAEALSNELDRTPFADAVARIDAMDRDTLVLLAQFGKCSWGIRAALVLDGRGDPSLLPYRGRSNEAAVIGRLLCLIANVPTTAPDGRAIANRQLEFLRGFLPRRGKVAYSTQGCGDDGNPGAEHESVFTRGDATGEELDDRFLALHGCEASPLPGQFICTGVGRATATDVTLTPGADGPLYISAIRYSRMGACD